MNESVQEVTETPQPLPTNSGAPLVSVPATPKAPPILHEDGRPIGNILRKMGLIMADLHYIQKDKRNEFHKYNYASEEALKEAAHDSCVARGVFFFPLYHKILERIGGQGKDGKEFVTRSEIGYRFYDIGSGEYLDGYAQGEGADSLDKGPYKGYTGIVKYVWFDTFLIPTGNEPEDGTPRQDLGKKPEPAKPAAPPQQQPKAENKTQAPPPAKAEPPKALPPTAIPGVVTGAAISEPKKAELPPEDDLSKDRAPGQELPTDAQSKELNKRIIAFAESVAVPKAQIGVYLKNKLCLDPTASLTLAYKKFSFSFLVAALDKYLKPEFAKEIKKAV